MLVILEAAKHMHGVLTHYNGVDSFHYYITYHIHIILSCSSSKC